MATEHDMYLIRNENNSEDFWSNDLGWCSRESADIFCEEEKENFNLPINGEWVKDELEQVTIVIKGGVIQSAYFDVFKIKLNVIDLDNPSYDENFPSDGPANSQDVIDMVHDVKEYIEEE